MNCFRAWEDTAIYSSDFLIKIQNIFLGISNKEIIVQAEQTKSLSENIDGVPIDPDLDGEEMLEESAKDTHSFSTKFKPSKWETIDPDVVESQAITSKWENLDKSTAIFADDDIDGKPLDDNDYFESLINNKNLQETKTSDYSQTVHSATLSREVLREIELKVVKYQDDLDNGRLRITDNQTLTQMVERYRADLVRKASTTQDASKTSLSASSGNPQNARSPKSRYSHHNSKRYSSPSRRSRSRSPTKKKK